MIAPPTVQSSIPRTDASGGRVFVQHDWLFGAVFLIFWAFGIIFWYLSERGSEFSVGLGWSKITSPLVVVGLWKILNRRVFTFERGRRIVRVAGFSPLKGRFSDEHSCNSVKLRVMKRFVIGKPGRTWWMVMLKGSGFDIALSWSHTQQEANLQLKEYSDILKTG
ncbi:MAG: hypothetical protein SFY80_02475 [Verrucomicrobiota bacterium]|nr:hypothetical protein [Verrucomicrobiota bacterium]